MNPVASLHTSFHSWSIPFHYWSLDETYSVFAFSLLSLSPFCHFCRYCASDFIYFNYYLTFLPRTFCALRSQAGPWQPLRLPSIQITFCLDWLVLDHYPMSPIITCLHTCRCIVHHCVTLQALPYHAHHTAMSSLVQYLMQVAPVLSSAAADVSQSSPAVSTESTGSGGNHTTTMNSTFNNVPEMVDDVTSDLENQYVDAPEQQPQGTADIDWNHHLIRAPLKGNESTWELWIDVWWWSFVDVSRKPHCESFLAWICFLERLIELWGYGGMR